MDIILPVKAQLVKGVILSITIPYVAGGKSILERTVNDQALL